MVDKNFLAMVNFLSLSALGKCGQLDDDIDINLVLKYASEHSVIPLVINGIQKSGFFTDHPLMLKCQEISLQMVARDIKNSFVVRGIFETFEKEKIGYAILKGDSLSAIYAEPDLRISGDVDLLVSEKDENKALKILENAGYYYEKRPDWGNETVAKHDKYKIIEVHTKLFDESRNDIFFNNIIKEPRNFTILSSSNYGNISVLNPDDGMMFVFLHFVKHFLSAGAGVRQLMDVLVYTIHYLDEIDWTDFFDKLKQIKYDRLYSCILSIAVLWLGISKNLLPEFDEDVISTEKVLFDLQRGGIFGHNEKELEQFKRIYEKKRFESYSKGDYDVYEKRYNKSRLKFLFPGTAYMAKKYTYVRKCRALVIFAWINRIVKGVLKVFLNKQKMSDYKLETIAVENEKINERMKLIKDLGLL